MSITKSELEKLLNEQTESLLASDLIVVKTIKHTMNRLYNKVDGLKQVLDNMLAITIEKNEFDKNSLFSLKETLDEQNRNREKEKEKIRNNNDDDEKKSDVTPVKNSNDSLWSDLSKGLAIGASTVAAGVTAIGAFIKKGGEKLFKGVLKGGAIGILLNVVGKTAVDLLTDFMEDKDLANEIKEKSGPAIDNASTGATIGASIGMFFGPAGIVIGTILGGIAGFAYTFKDEIADKFVDLYKQAVQLIKDSGLFDIMDDIKDGWNFVTQKFSEFKKDIESLFGYKPKPKMVPTGPMIAPETMDYKAPSIKDYTDSKSAKNVLDDVNRRIAELEKKEFDLQTSIELFKLKQQREELQQDAAPEIKQVPKETGPGIIPETMEAKPVSLQLTPQQEVTKALVKVGITDPLAIQQVLGQVEAESNFSPIDENLNYSPERLYKVFPSKFDDLEDAKKTVSLGKEAIGNKVYGGRMGNAADEGYKYRGRGFIQLTGKENYEKIGKMIGEDLVSDPDLLLDPSISAKAAAAYFKTKQNKFDLTTAIGATKAVAPAGNLNEKAIKREELGKKYDVAELLPKETKKEAMTTVDARQYNTNNTTSSGKNNGNQSLVVAAESKPVRIGQAISLV